MIKLDKKYIEAVENAGSLEDLFPLLQNAIKLEHATIPTYLSAMMSIKPGTNESIAAIFQSIVVEEMLHLSIACNILNAIGGAPEINVPGFIPTYPGPLPMGIDHDLTVQLVPLSLSAVHDIYMAIEEPEDPIIFPIKISAFLEATEATYATIGLFYRAVQAQLLLLAPDKLPGDPARQMTQLFPPDQLFPILTRQDAINAINIIVEQGEGTTKKPTDQQGELAHYYRFAEVFNGKQLVPDKSEPKGYSYSGAPIVLDTAGVFNMKPNTKMADLAAGSEAWNAASEFNQAYSRLLNVLHATFNGKPNLIASTLGMMYDIKLYGEKLAAMPFPGKAGVTVGPPFEFVQVLP